MGTKVWPELLRELYGMQDGNSEYLHSIIKFRDCTTSCAVVM